MENRLIFQRQSVLRDWSSFRYFSLQISNSYTYFHTKKLITMRSHFTLANSSENFTESYLHQVSQSCELETNNFETTFGWHKRNYLLLILDISKTLVNFQLCTSISNVSMSIFVDVFHNAIYCPTSHFLVIDSYSLLLELDSAKSLIFIQQWIINDTRFDFNIFNWVPTGSHLRRLLLFFIKRLLLLEHINVHCT